MIKPTKTHEIDYVSASGGNCAHRCLAKYYFEKVCRFYDATAPRMALDYGKMHHAAVEHSYGPDAFRDSFKCFMDLWQEGDYEFDKKRNPERAGAMIEDYCNFHRPQLCPYEPLNPPDTREMFKNYHGTSSMEFPFLFDFGGKLLALGLIDRLVKWKDTGDLWVLDYKTTSEISPRFFNNFEFSVQALMYTLAGTIITGKHIKGMIIEAFRVSPKNCETQLHHVYVQEHQLEKYIEWLKDVSSKITQANEKKEWLQEPAGCAPYGMFGVAGYQCRFYSMCMIPDWKAGVKFFSVENYDPFGLREGVKNE